MNPLAFAFGNVTPATLTSPIRPLTNKLAKHGIAFTPLHRDSMNLSGTLTFFISAIRTILKRYFQGMFRRFQFVTLCELTLSALATAVVPPRISINKECVMPPCTQFVFLCKELLTGATKSVQSNHQNRFGESKCQYLMNFLATTILSLNKT